jgi:hypothetical protein
MSVENELPPLPKFRDLTELGEKLGLNNLNSLYAEIKEGRLVAYKFGKSYKVPVDEYDRYLKEREKADQRYDLGDLAESINASMQYMYTEIRKGRLQVLKVGKSYKVLPEEWQRYLESKKSSQNNDEEGDDEE